MGKIIIQTSQLSNNQSSISNFIELLKPRVMSLVVFSGLAGLLLAPGTIHPFIASMAILCIIMASGAAAAINMWYDRDIDSIMLRTQNRPLVRKVMEPDEALSFGVVLSVISVTLMSVCVNILSGILLLASILFYVFVYTMWLKRSSVQNIVIGGAAGALPPVIGWASVTNDITLMPIILFAIIFFWTPAHFWALALYKSDDYKRCNVPMMPVVKGDLYTKYQMLAYTILTAVFSCLPYILNQATLFYLSLAILLNAIFVYYNLALFKDKENKYAPRMFGYSIFYLFAILAILVIDKICLGGSYA